MIGTQTITSSTFMILNPGFKIVCILGAMLLHSLSAPAGLAAETGFLKVTGPCDLTFPKDHGAHPGYRTEWWYYTGNLVDQNQRPFGFQLTFFRSQLLPSESVLSWPQPASPWRSNQVFMAHAAISDMHAERHLSAEKIARGAMGMAGIQRENQMVFLLRQKHNRPNPAGSGTFVTRDGRTLALSSDEISITAEEHWKSPHSKAIYPSRWQLTIDKLNLNLDIISNLSDQEMQSPQTTQITYWEGSVRTSGKRQGRAVSGSGYVELTGYAQPFDAPL